MNQTSLFIQSTQTYLGLCFISSAVSPTMVPLEEISDEEGEHFFSVQNLTDQQDGEKQQMSSKKYQNLESPICEDLPEIKYE